MTYRYMLDDDGNPVPCKDEGLDGLLKWAEWLTDARKRVAFDQIGEVEVSTVFLGIDHALGLGRRHAPVLWETMVFGGPLNYEQERYTSRADALAGHANMVARVRKAKP